MNLRKAIVVCLCWVSSLLFADAGVAGRNEILGTNGLFFDAEDHLYVASVVGGQLLVLDRESGEVLKVFDKKNGVLSPDDVTLDNEGTAYVTNILQGTVTAVKRDGTFANIADLGRGVNSITVGADGGIWVGRDFLGQGLYRLDPRGIRSPQTIIEKSGWINAMDFGPDGMLYGPLFKPASIVRIDPQTGTVATVFNDFESEPYALKFDRKGQLHALEGMSGRVLKIDLATGEKKILARYAPGLDNLAFDSTDRLFVSSFYDGSIHEVMKDGSLREVRGPSKRMVRMLAISAVTAFAIIAALIIGLAFAIKRSRLSIARE